MYTPRRRAHRRILLKLAVIACITLVFGLALAAHPQVAAADTIYVDVTRGNDVTGNGSLGRPFRTITRGLDAAASGDTVDVSAGEYSPATGEALPLTVPRGVTVQGDTPSSREYEELRGTVIKGNDTGRLMQILSGDRNTVIDGIHFTENDSPVRGGAVYILGGALPGGVPIVRDCLFTELSAPSGGAIWIERGMSTYCAPRLERTMIFGTTANGPNPRGGALGAMGADCTIEDSVFLLCRCAAVFDPAGGALSLVDSGQSTIRRSEIYGCGIPTGVGGLGGAAYAFNHNLRIAESTIQGCGADYGGVVHAFDNAAPYDTTVLVENSVFVGNQGVQQGGALSLNNVDSTLANCTLYMNRSTAGAGGVDYDAGAHQVHNSILWENGDEVRTAGGATLGIGWSCIQDLDGGPGVSHDDPLFMENPIHLRLRHDSPCVDKGNNVLATSIDVEGRDRPADGDHDGIAVVDMGAYERAPIVDRAAGSVRYTTAIAASQRNFTVADHVILATGAAYPDALCAAPLAGLVRGPILLTTPSALPAGLTLELERLGAEKVYIIGGTGAVSESVAEELRNLGYEVERIGGADRYATSRAIAQELSDIVGAGLTGTTIVARGDAFPDALSASPLAYNRQIPILLTRPDVLPPSIDTAITDFGFVRAIVVGGEGAVSPAVFDRLAGMLAPGATTRVGGVDRYATATTFAQFVQADSNLQYAYSNDVIGLATGLNFPDALCGGAVCGLDSAPLLLTRTDAMPAVTRDYIAEYAETLVHVQAFGGTSVVSDAVLDDVRRLIP